jgi:hypothetical protein
MSEMFSYTARPSSVIDQRMIAPAPLFPDMNQNSEGMRKLVQAKQTNDENYWSTMREVFAHDAETLPLQRFKVWMSTLSVPLMSQARHSEYIRLGLDAAQDPVYRDALTETYIGMTEQDHQMVFNMFSDFPTTMNRIQALGHLLFNGYDYEKIRSMKTIVELGGGVGDLCDTVYRLGFTGDYYIYDFPEISKLQEYHLTTAGHENVKFINSTDSLVAGDLVVATWSLTEMPLDLRDIVVDKLQDSKEWIVAYSNKIFGIDNDAWIKETFIPKMKNKTCEINALDFMPWDGGTFYLTVK